MPIIKGRILNLHWREEEYAAQEASIEVEHENGDIQMFVVPILRMTKRHPKPKEKDAKRL